MSRKRQERTQARGSQQPPAAVPTHAIEAALARAVEHHRAGRLPEAAGIYQEILGARPGHADALHLFGVLNAQAGRLDEAVALLTKATRKQPRNAAFLGDLGQALARLGKADEAITTYRRATGIDRGNADLHYGLGNALRQAGHLGQAADAFGKALSIRDDHLPAQSHLGLTLFDMGQGEAALTAFTRAVEIDPSAAEAHSNLGNAQRELGELEEAEASLRRAIELRPDYAAAHCNLGNVLQNLHRPEEAVVVYRRAIELDPDYATAHSNLGNALQSLHRFEEAVASGEKAVGLSPRRDTFLSNLGVSYIASGDHTEALARFERASVVRHGAPLTAQALTALPPATDNREVVPFKLQHDAEQIRYLRNEGVLSEPFEEVATRYQEILDGLPTERSPTMPVKLSQARWRRIGSTYNRPFFVPDTEAAPDGALNPELDARAIEDTYLGSDPNVVFFDGFLREDVLERLWRFCLEATIWYQVKHGYLGAYLVDGFGTELTLQIADDLRRRFPRIFREHRLNQLWAYKYDPRLEGIKIHADFAAVNVNFWVTPDVANRDPNSGGLVVHKAVAPSDWAFRKYNTNVSAMEEFVRSTGGEPLTVPYRQNRVVIFDSDLFHRTDDLDFDPGYENRRINITMLFGDRHDD